MWTRILLLFLNFRMWVTIVFNLIKLVFQFNLKRNEPYIEIPKEWPSDKDFCFPTYHVPAGSFVFLDKQAIVGRVSNEFKAVGAFRAPVGLHTLDICTSPKTWYSFSIKVINSGV